MHLSALQRTHEVYRLAREKVDAQERDEAASRSREASPPSAPRDTTTARAAAERELSESLRKVRAAQAAQALANRRAAEERQQLQTALREAREVAAQNAAHSREELQQERQRRAALQQEAEREAATTEAPRRLLTVLLHRPPQVQLATAQQRLATREAAAKKEATGLEAMLIDAQSRLEARGRATSAQLREALAAEERPVPPVEEPPLAVSLEPPAEPSEPPPAEPPTPATPALETTPFSLFDAALARRGADGESLLVFGGGGGASKTGVPNALVVTRLDASWQMQLVGEHRTGLAPVQSLALSPTADRLACLQGADVLLYSGVDAPAPPAEPPTWESVATVDKKRPPPPPLYASPAMVLRGPDPDPEADGIRKPRLPEPAFRWHNFVTPAPKRRGKPLPKTAAWRCVLMAEGSSSGASLFGALNHAAGVGHVTPNRLTALALSADGALLAAGTNEGELHVLQASSLARLVRLQEHPMYVAVLVLTERDAAGGYAAISCSTNEVKVTRLPKERLVPPTLSADRLLLLLALLAALVAAAFAHFAGGGGEAPGEPPAVGQRMRVRAPEVERVLPWTILPRSYTVTHPGSCHSCARKKRRNSMCDEYRYRMTIEDRPESGVRWEKFKKCLRAVGLGFCLSLVVVAPVSGFAFGAKTQDLTTKSKTSASPSASPFGLRGLVPTSK
ncbi:hypothetical protein EMIHUDRAFT_451505 [Emiliania huxleyi CCMP1516]|uniref:Uncharacterized protein n=2 Tax=Emiliania huxleyi TaxID=2903 RepID=A0A0D3IYA4_EMIH1|nr:hypothetical protein EMIHUDRAFT_451505 [Emiliania huxleyi CCMP1516]EOD16239.1 hypothetical protein EMIHUDRAFT_451505 [Emiliania huxleyi CCMP1516]|eukprot:XP_005768668.1 hypothetical protein EMIHUDRAFT_451505 [Emiliania huxleyi CCMP1516]